MRKTIKAEALFLPTSEGGRPTLPDLSTPTTYRPHFVVARAGGDSDVPVMPLSEAHMGVIFLSAPEKIEFGVAFPVTVGLLYWPDADYSALTPGTTFHICEGSKIVGNGKVLDR